MGVSQCCCSAERLLVIAVLKTLLEREESTTTIEQLRSWLCWQMKTREGLPETTAPAGQVGPNGRMRRLQLTPRPGRLDLDLAPLSWEAGFRARNMPNSCELRNKNEPRPTLGCC